MTSLQNGQAADADDVNQNFELLSGQSLTNEERIKRLEDTSTRLFRDSENPAISPSAQLLAAPRPSLPAGTVPSLDMLRPSLQASPVTQSLDDGVVELLGGRLELDVNCEADPWALVDAYQSYGRYKELVLTLTGTCYGSYYWNREFTEGFREPFQALTLKAKEGDIASIVPRPSGSSEVQFHDQRISVFAMDGSFLSLQNIELYLGPIDPWGVFVWNGSYAKLSNVRIIDYAGGPAGIMRVAGLHIDNNSSVELSGLNTISLGYSYSAVLLDADSILRGYGGLKAFLYDCLTGTGQPSSECHAMDVRHSKVVVDISGEDAAWNLQIPSEVSQGYSMYAINSTLDFNQNGSPISARGWFVSRDGYLTVHGGIKVLDPDDYLSFSGRASIAHYKNFELPAEDIRCNGPNTLSLYGLADYEDPDSYTYLEHDAHSGPGQVLEGLSGKCISPQEWDYHLITFP